MTGPATAGCMAKIKFILRVCIAIMLFNMTCLAQGPVAGEYRKTLNHGPSNNFHQPDRVMPEQFFLRNNESTDSTPPVLIDPSKGCSSLDAVIEGGCYRDELNFDGRSLEESVAALYQDESGPVTATFLYRISAANNYCSWSFFYIYKIEDIHANFVTCEVNRKGIDDFLPTFTVPADFIVYQNNDCNAGIPTPDISGNVTDAYDNCGIAEITYADCNDKKGVGINLGEEVCSEFCPKQIIIERRWFVRDSCGNQTMKAQKIYILDTVKPVFTVFPPDFSTSGCYGVTYDVEALDNCSGLAGLTYEFSGSTTGSGSGTGSGSTFNFGDTRITITATDCAGNKQIKSFNLSVTCDKNMIIDISAGITRTIYRGLAENGQGPFGPQSINLCSIVTGGTPGYTYQWTPTTGLSNPNISNPVASPTETTIYFLLVTDHNGHTASLSITINVLQLSSLICSGNGNNIKYRVCHIPPGNPANPQNICISASALNAHLIQGNNGHNKCHLGYCGEQLCFSTRPGGCQGSCGGGFVPTPGTMETNPVMTDELNVVVSPNPSSSNFIIQVTGKSNEPVTVRIFDKNGVVKSVNTLSSKTNSIMVGSKLPTGIYVAEVIQGNNRQTLKLIKLN
jgi:hypothetical protein